MFKTHIKQRARVIQFVLACVLTFALPSTALAIYPSGGGLPDPGLERNLKDSEQITNSFKQEFPFYERDENGKPITSEFVKYDLSGYDLSDVDLRGVLFSVSTLKRANLENANLEDSIAYATHFEESNLKNTNFRNAVLSKSFFMATEIEGADFTGAIIDDPQRESLCARASGVNSITGADTFESLDCLSLSTRSIR
ncbi:pentapeptide repeat-containing protein [Synechococcus sp. MIT S1220]|uniref:pentapeptide repeat-containing protein n=1 Tax=Synechococcus sp. MIT S1220 TaxID=3082549 RepID=UPI0039B06ABC